MGKKIGLVFLLFFIFSKPCWAENNKIGIHILEPTEVEKAALLVNSAGGDWGYVTIVLRDDDFDQDKWQRFMDDCRRLHLIPMIRIATHMEDGNWAKPKKDDLDKWVKFLDSLNWPVKQQIVILFNEPNHAKEWGNEINAPEYALFSSILIQKFNESNSDYFLMLAGFDQSADGRNGTMRQEEFMRQMLAGDSEIFNKIDGWASHSYPNQGFVGQPSDIGRGSIKGYEWEIEQITRLQDYKNISDLEVYITETGWPSGRGYYAEETAADYLLQALDIWEKDARVKAVTPFVLNYPSPPFEKFSWLKEDGELSERYKKVLGVSKKKGEPEQREDYQVVGFHLAEILPTDCEVKGKVRIRNTGQWIMGEEDNFQFSIYNLQKREDLEIEQPELKEGELVQPGEEIELEFKVRTGTQSAEHKLRIGDKEQTLYVFKPYDLKHPKVSLWKQIWTRIKLGLGWQ